jgi:hypothetical protein
MPLSGQWLEITRSSFGKILRQISFVPAQADPALSRAFRSFSNQIAWMLPAASVRAEAGRLSPDPATEAYRLTQSLLPETSFSSNAERLTE